MGITEPAIFGVNLRFGKPFVMGCIAGSVVHLFRMKVCGAGRMLALGPYLSVGIFIAALWGNGMIDWYLGLFM